MIENQGWSFSIGRWGSVSLRVHMLFLLAVIVIFGAEWNYGATNQNFFSGTAVVTSMALLLAVLVHQTVKAFSISCLGSEVHEIEIAPWGGNCVSDLEDSNIASVFANASGLFANGMLFLMGFVLLYQTDQFNGINPFRPTRFDINSPQITALQIFSWVNFQLMLINFIACHPFDGAKIARSAIASFELPLSKYRSEKAIMLIGHACAFALIGTGIILMVRNYEPGIQIAGPSWMVLLFAGVTLFFSARYSMIVETTENEEPWEELEDQDFGMMFDMLEGREINLEGDQESFAYSQWLNEKQAARRRYELELEVEEDGWADRVLAKLHSHGGDLDCLTDPERGVLDRFSARVRRRREQGQGLTESS